MFQYNIIPSVIKNIIENEFEYVYVVFSPLHIGQIDIFIDLEEIEKMEINLNKEFYVELFLQEVLRPKILDITISGISKIKDYYIQKRNNLINFLLIQKEPNMNEFIKIRFH